MPKRLKLFRRVPRRSSKDLITRIALYQLRDRLLTRAEFAALCGTAPRTLYHWQREVPGFPQPRRFGKRVRFLRKEVEAFLAAWDDALEHERNKDVIAESNDGQVRIINHGDTNDQ